MWKQFSLFSVTHNQKERTYFFCFWFQYHLFPYSLRCESVSVDDTNVCECFFSNTYWNNNYFCPFNFLLVWVLFLHGFELEEQITRFQWYFPFRKIPMKQLFRFFSLISGITYSDAFTGGEQEISLCCWSRSSSGSAKGYLEEILFLRLPSRAFPTQASN